MNPFKPTASPFVARPTMAKMRALNPVEWGRYGLHRATRGLEQTGVGRAVGAGTRSALHAIRTSPLRSLGDAIRPGAGKYVSWGAKGVAATPLAYAGYKAQRALPDAVDGELQRADVDEGIRNDQWWRTWGAQPKMLYHGLAPTWAGGDDTRVGKMPSTYLKHVVEDTPRDADGNLVTPDAPDAVRAVTQAPKNYLPTPSTLLRQTALKNVEDNLADGQDAVMRNTAKDFAKDLRSDAPQHAGLPRSLAELTARAKQEAAWLDGTKKELARSPLLNDVTDSIDPRLYEDPKAVNALMKTYTGEASGLASDHVIQAASVKGLVPPAPGMKFEGGSYWGRTSGGGYTAYNPKTKQWSLQPDISSWSKPIPGPPPDIVPYHTK